MPLSALVVVLPVLFLLGCGHDTAMPWRLVDHAPGGTITAVVADMTVEALDPTPEELVVSLADAPRASRFTFVIGVAAGSEQTVRFEAALRTPGASNDKVIYRHDLPSGTWVEGDVDLHAERLDGRALVLRKRTAFGPRGGLGYAYWGAPVLLPAAPRPGPLVVVVSLDTMRADHLGAYAPGTGAVTPALDRLANAAVLYDAVYAPSTWTLPSHRALFSGRFPAEVPDSKPLPSITNDLRAAGYLTAAFTGGGFVGGYWGFATGFERYYGYVAPADAGPPTCSAARLDGPEVFRLAVEWLHRYGRYPGFLFVHTYDAHDRCPFARPGDVFAPLDREKLPAMRDYYAATVTQVDNLVDLLVRTIDGLDREGETILIVTSDHGEALGEHEEIGHGPDMRPYEELARIPLIIRVSGRSAGTRVVEPVALVDVAPTVLAALGLPVPQEMRGRVLPGLGLQTVSTPRALWIDAGKASAVRIGDNKLVSQQAGGPSDQVFDIPHDPFERHDIRLLVPDVYAALRRQATEYALLGTGAESPSLNDVAPTMRERLKALGYAN